MDLENDICPRGQAGTSQATLLFSFPGLKVSETFAKTVSAADRVSAPGTILRSHCVLKRIWSVDLRLPSPPPPPCPSHPSSPLPFLLFIYLLSTPLPSPHFVFSHLLLLRTLLILFLSIIFPFSFFCFPLLFLSLILSLLPLHSSSSYPISSPSILFPSSPLFPSLISCSKLCPLLIFSPSPPFLLPLPAVSCLKGKEQDIVPTS